MYNNSKNEAHHFQVVKFWFSYTWRKLASTAASEEHKSFFQIFRSVLRTYTQPFLLWYPVLLFVTENITRIFKRNPIWAFLCYWHYDALSTQQLQYQSKYCCFNGSRMPFLTFSNILAVHHPLKIFSSRRRCCTWLNNALWRSPLKLRCSTTYSCALSAIGLILKHFLQKRVYESLRWCVLVALNLILIFIFLNVQHC